LLRLIKEEAERINRPEFQSKREKLLKFAEKRNGLNSSTTRAELVHIITGKYDRLHPQDLLNDIGTALKITPY
jgi:hypothetical protein